MTLEDQLASAQNKLRQAESSVRKAQAELDLGFQTSRSRWNFAKTAENRYRIVVEQITALLIDQGMNVPLIEEEGDQIVMIDEGIMPPVRNTFEGEEDQDEIITQPSNFGILAVIGAMVIL